MRTLLVLLALTASADAKRVNPAFCEIPLGKDLVSHATRVYAGQVKSVAQGRATIAVTDVWKGDVAASETHDKSDCDVLRYVDAQVIVIDLPKDFSFTVKSGCTRLCIGAYADSADNRKLVVDALGKPTRP